jgi:hypothetical protein
MKGMNVHQSKQGLKEEANILIHQEGDRLELTEAEPKEGKMHLNWDISPKLEKSEGI